MVAAQVAGRPERTCAPKVLLCERDAGLSSPGAVVAAATSAAAVAAVLSLTWAIPQVHWWIVNTRWYPCRRRCRESHSRSIATPWQKRLDQQKRTNKIMQECRNYVVTALLCECFSARKFLMKNRSDHRSAGNLYSTVSDWVNDHERWILTPTLISEASSWSWKRDKISVSSSERRDITFLVFPEYNERKRFKFQCERGARVRN